MAPQSPRPAGQVTSAIHQIEAAFIQLRDEIITLEEAISPALKPEYLDTCGTEKSDVPERSPLTNELELHLDRIRGLRNRVSDLISRVDI